MGNTNHLDRAHKLIRRDQANLKQQYTNGARDHQDSWWWSRSAEAQQYRALLKAQLEEFLKHKKDDDTDHNNKLLASLGELQRFATFLHGAQEDHDNREALQALLYNKAKKSKIEGETALACLLALSERLGDTLTFDTAPSLFDTQYQKSKDENGNVQDPERNYQDDLQKFQLRESLFDTRGLLSLLEGQPHPTLQNLMSFGNVIQSMKNLVSFRRAGLDTSEGGTIIVGELGEMVNGQTATSTVKDQDAWMFKAKKMTLTLTMADNNIDVQVKNVSTRASKRYPGITQLVETARLMRDQGQWHTDDGRQCVATLRLHNRAQDTAFNRHEEAQLARALKLANQVGLAVEMDTKNQKKMNAWVNKQRERFASTKALRNRDTFNKWTSTAPCQLHTDDEPCLAYWVNQDLAKIIDRLPQRPTAGLTDTVTDFSQAQHTLAMLATLAVEIAVHAGRELKTTVKDLQSDEHKADKEPLGKLLYIAKLKETWMKRFADDPTVQNELQAHWNMQLMMASSAKKTELDATQQSHVGTNLSNANLNTNATLFNIENFSHDTADLFASGVGIKDTDLTDEHQQSIASAIVAMEADLSQLNTSCETITAALDNLNTGEQDPWLTGMQQRVQTLKDSSDKTMALRELRDAFCNRTQAPSVVVSDDIKAELAKSLEKEIDPESIVTPTRGPSGMGSTSL